MVKELVAKVIDVETGEVLDELYSGDKIVHPQPKPDDDLVKGYNSDKRFVKLFEGVNELRQYLNNNGEFTTAISLADYICYEDCILRYRGMRKGRILDAKTLSELMDIPYKTLCRHINSLMKKGIIAITKVGNKDNPDELIEVYVANPNIYLRGCDVNKTALGLFEKSGWNSYKQDIIRGDVKEI